MKVSSPPNGETTSPPCSPPTTLLPPPGPPLSRESGSPNKEGPSSPCGYSDVYKMVETRVAEARAELRERYEKELQDARASAWRKSQELADTKELLSKLHREVQDLTAERHRLKIQVVELTAKEKTQAEMSEMVMARLARETRGAAEAIADAKLLRDELEKVRAKLAAADTEKRDDVTKFGYYAGRLMKVSTKSSSPQVSRQNSKQKSALESIDPSVDDAEDPSSLAFDVKANALDKIEAPVISITDTSQVNAPVKVQYPSTTNDCSTLQTLQDVRERLGVGPCVCFLSEPSCRDSDLEAIIAEFAAQLSREPKLANASFVTQGVPGAQEVFAKSFADGSRLWRLLHGEDPGVGIGRDLRVAGKPDDVSAIFREIGHVYVAAGNGPEFAKQVKQISDNDLPVVPLMRRGGASLGNVARPAFANEGHWALLSNTQAQLPAAAIVAAAVSLVAEAIAVRQGTARAVAALGDNAKGKNRASGERTPSFGSWSNT